MGGDVHASGEPGPGPGPDPALPVLRASRLRGEIRIDGVVNDDAWLAATPCTDFIQREPDEGSAVSERTEVRILVGRDALYVGARLFDREPNGIRAALSRRDAHGDFDYVTVSLDSRHDRNTAFVFTLAPSGAYLDGALGTDGTVDNGWDPVWEGAATVDGQGWSAEWRIPFSQLRFTSAEDAVWGIQITRFIARKQEVATFPFAPRSETWGPHRYAQLVLGRVEALQRVEVAPYATVRSEQLIVDPANPFRGSNRRIYNAGLDLKYGIGGGLTLDASFNPDFGQVEVDPAVVNLTQYETYYPERRPFFVEGAEVFQYGFPGVSMNPLELGSLFYSRRIGRAPQGGFPGVDAAFTDTPEQTTIAAASKLSGRTGAWSLGVLDAFTTREDGRYATTDGQRGTVVVEPATNYFVGRVRRDFRNGNSTLGGIATAVTRNLSGTGMDSLLHAEAFVAGLDFNHMWKDREWFVTGTITGSRVQGTTQSILRTQLSSARYFQRPDARHERLDSARTSLQGWRGSFSAGRRAGDHWLGGVALQAKSPGFEVNDLGFESRVDSWGLSLPMRYRDMVPNRWTQSFQVDVVPYAERNFDGDLVGANVFLGSVQQWRNFWASSTTLDLTARWYSDGDTRGGPVIPRPAAITLSEYIGTDARKKQSAEASFTWAENEWGGRGVAAHVGMSLRPSPALELTLGPTYTRVHAAAQYVAAVADPRAVRTYGTRYVYAVLDQTTVSMDTRVNWTFTPHLSLQIFAQPLISGGDYSRFMELHQPRVWDWDVYGEETGTLVEIPDGFRIDPDGGGPSAAFTVPNPDFKIRSLRGNAVLRWEYRPGSTLYLVWQQRRYGDLSQADSSLSDDVGALTRLHPENIFALKVSYWWGR
jgi:hypothetical protein